MKTHSKFAALALASCLATGAIAVAEAQDGMMMSGDMKMMKMGNMNVASPMETKKAIDSNFDRLFMIHSSMGNQAEVMLGQLALKKSRNSGVRQVAQTIIKGHGTAEADLRKHFQAMSLPIPPDPGPVNKAFYKELSRLSGSAFDKMFMAGQVGAHEQTVTLFEHEIMGGKNETAKAFATNKLQGILMHTALIYGVAKQVGAPGTNLRPAELANLAKPAR